MKLISPDLLHPLTDMKLEKKNWYVSVENIKEEGCNWVQEGQEQQSGKSKQTHKKAKELGVCWGSVGSIRHFSHLKFTNLFETREQAK